MDNFISVIITAYNRKQFLFESINSVLNQTLSRDKYEIIVVKNFEEEIIDKMISENKIISILTGNCSIGEMLKLGIHRARGNVISFLDDDDRFSHLKLKYINNEFEASPNLIFLHNGQEFINSQSVVLDDKLSRFNHFREISYGCNNLQSLYKKLVNLHLDLGCLYFNLSSITIRKEVLLENSDILNRLRANTDGFVFLYSCSFVGIMKHISNKLTFYRYHNSTSNVLSRLDDEMVLSNRKEQLINIRDSYILAMDLKQDPIIKRYIASKISFLELCILKISGQTIELLGNTLRTMMKRSLVILPGLKTSDRLKIYLGFMIFSVFYPVSLRIKYFDKIAKKYPHILSLRKFV